MVRLLILFNFFKISLRLKIKLFILFFLPKKIIEKILSFFLSNFKKNFFFIFSLIYSAPLKVICPLLSENILKLSFVITLQNLFLLLQINSK